MQSRWHRHCGEHPSVRSAKPRVAASLIDRCSGEMCVTHFFFNPSVIFRSLSLNGAFASQVSRAYTDTCLEQRIGSNAG
jgi:hypothetical protein